MIEYENLKKTNNFFFKKFEIEYKKFSLNGKYILSKEVLNFEKKFSSFLKAPFCSGVANGLDALILSLESLKLPKNSEVIVPANTYYATILAVLRSGLKPVLVEPDYFTCNINYKEIVKKITKKTKVILAVHLYGKACEMSPIIKICKENKLYLIEDCAQAHGAKYKNKYVGTFGDFGCFSFYPTKNLGCLGDGGAIVSRIKSNDIYIKMLRNYGSLKRYKNEIIGFNSRLDEFQAAFLKIKLKYLDKINKHKRNLASIYNKNLNNRFIKPVIQKDFYDVFYVYNVRYQKRDQLQKFLKSQKIMTDIHYSLPPYKQNAIKALFQNQKFPISDEIHKTTLSLPISFMNTEKEIEKVCDIVNKFI
jgi:dTDP-4-amino-4,6-dideoxygalactose transaminase